MKQHYMKHCVSHGKTGRLEAGWLGSTPEQVHHRHCSAHLNVVKLVMEKQKSAAQFDSTEPKVLVEICTSESTASSIYSYVYASNKVTHLAV